MDEEFLMNANECYRQAEQRAAHYFKLLEVQVKVKSYVPLLLKDFQQWKIAHLHHPSIFSFFSSQRKRQKQLDYRHYLKWLEYTGKLEDYLNRSVSYLFLRDLGKSLDSTITQQKIRNIVSSLKEQLTQHNYTKKGELFSIAGMYRYAQEEGIESTMIWLFDKLNTLSSNIPKGLDVIHAQRKLIKIIAGIIMHFKEEFGEELSKEEQSEKLDVAIRLGYCYGLTYPFIDDLLDSSVLTEKQKEQYADLIRTTLTTGDVPDLGEWPEEKLQFMQYIHSELKSAFEYIKSQQLPETRKAFFEQTYIFFQSQEIDRLKDLYCATYTNEQLYIPIILKSSSSRMVARMLLSVPEDEEFNERTFLYGIYNQLSDDFADMFDDLENGIVTPYTYYLKHHSKHQELINPFELYWTVISNLIHNVYHSDIKAREVILDRAINGLKRFKSRVGDEKYKEVMNLFAMANQELNKILDLMVKRADDVDFFDKLLRDHMITTLKNEKHEQEDFIHQMKIIRKEIHQHLIISKKETPSGIKDVILDAANFSLDGEGKRLRPIMTWFMGIQVYGLEQSSIMPLLKAVEYLHTASLIFDDLPSQDNASIRRGRRTIHEMYNVAIAELTGLFLMQKAVEEQTNLNDFDGETVLKMIRYSAKMTAQMCRGQVMDLESRGKSLTIQELNQISFYKTGIGFEAALIMPAILAQVNEVEIQALKKYARHAGIAFQIKDDILDVEGKEANLGKPLYQDLENQQSTFVSVLGIDEAKKVMWDHYCHAIEALQEIPRDVAFLKCLLNVIVNRNY